MSPDVIPVALLILAAIAAVLVFVVVGIYFRITKLIETMTELRSLAIGSQVELVQAKEGIDRMHVDLGRLVATSSTTSELVRSASRLPTR